MSIFDLMALVFENLGRRKARVALTAVGVIIGTASVVVLVSLGIGLQESTTRQLYGVSNLSLIQVSQQFDGGLGGGGIQLSGGGGGGVGGPRALNESALAEMAALPNVALVVPRDMLQGGAVARLGPLEGYLGFTGLGVITDVATLGYKVQQGSGQLTKGGLVIGANVALNFYNPRQRPGDPPPEPPDLLGQVLSVSLIKYTDQGEEVRRNLKLRVVGVLAESRDDQDYQAFMLMSELDTLNTWFTGKKPNRAKDGYMQAIVKVSDVPQAADTAKAITDMGFQAYTPQETVQSINNTFLIMQVVFGGVGAIALLVAAIGIANTMAMAILERTREIGLMKAVGATNRDVLSVFLGESAGIGFIGGLGGVTLGWVAGQMVQVAAGALLAQGGGVPGGGFGNPLDVAVITPWWLMVAALVFSTIIGLLSGLYPSLRAATMIPVLALKYE